MEIKFVSKQDCSAILNIYSQYICTPITFEYLLPPKSEFARRIENISAQYPYLACVDGGHIVGYAYAHRQMERPAYQWNAELSIYMDQAYTSKGFGRTLYGTLIKILQLQGVKTVYGGVTLPNEKSENLHLSVGFKRIGIYRNTGYKNGKWHDVAWFEKQISPYEINPSPFIPISDIPQSTLYDIIKGTSTIN